jgi:hypothetical protein
MVNVPTNPRLYESVKAQAKEKFDVWPSAYASGWLVKTYKARGGKYTTTPDSTSQKNTNANHSDDRPLGRWYDEKWADVCRYLETGKLTSCGRHRASSTSGKYPYCRPTVRISKETPETLDEIPRQVLERRCKKKREGKSNIRIT